MNENQPNPKREKLISLVKQFTDGSLATDKEVDDVMYEIESLAPTSGAPDVVFWSLGLTEEEMADRILSMKPIILGPPSQEN